MSVAVSPSTDLLDNQFIKPVFTSEVPTSQKFNYFGAYTGTQFDVLSSVIGNPYLLGIANLAGAIGDIRELLPTPTLDPDLPLASTPKIFSNTSLYLNEMTATVSTGGSGKTIALTSGTLRGTHVKHLGSDGAGLPVVNVALAKKTAGYISEVWTGPFETLGGYAHGNDIVTFSYPGGTVTDGDTYYVIATNYSISELLLEALTNIGSVSYSWLDGYIDSDNDDTIETITSGAPTLTTMVDNISDKPFVVRWHIRVATASPSRTSGGNTLWDITSDDSTKIVASHPGAETIKAYLTSAYETIDVTTGPGLSPVAGLAVANGAPVLDGSGNAAVVFMDLVGQTLTIGLPTSPYMATLPDHIDFYIPVRIPYRLLQSVALSYDWENAGIKELLANVIGVQYAWNAAWPTGDTIADRLDSTESDVDTLQSQVGTIGDMAIPNGSFEHENLTGWTQGSSGGTPTFSAVAYAGAGDTNTTHGQYAAKISGAAGVMGSLLSTPIPWSFSTDAYIKFKTKSTRTDVTVVMDLVCYDGDGASLGTVDNIYTNSGTSGTAWATFYGHATAAQIAGISSDTRKIACRVKATNAAVAANTYFDDIKLFEPCSDGVITKYRVADTYTIHTGPNCISLKAELLGGGGGGGDNSGMLGITGGDGGGGGGLIVLQDAVNPDTDYVLEIGAAGGGEADGGAGPYAQAGGDTTFLSFQAKGGGGAAQASAAPGTAGECQKNGIALTSNTSGILYYKTGYPGLSNAGTVGGRGGGGGPDTYYNLMSAVWAEGGEAAGGNGKGNGGGGGGANGGGGAGGNGAPGAANIYS